MSDPPIAIRGEIASDQQEFMSLLEPLLPAAHQLAAGVLRSRSEAEDAVQDAVLKAWQHFSQFRRDADLKPWLFTIVANECRRRQRTRWWSITTLPETIEGAAGDPSMDAESADLRRAIYRLPYEQRLVLALRYYLDLSFEEVAQTLGVSTNSAKQRTYRALKRLRLSPEVLGDE